MGKEIEKKFLIDKSKLILNKEYFDEIKQGYLNFNENVKAFIIIENDISLIKVSDNINTFFINIPKDDSADLLECFCNENDELILNKESKNVLRVRISNKVAYLTFKGPNEGIERPEFEYQIDFLDATEMLDSFCTSYIYKKRFYILYKGYKWEIDFFEGDNTGLAIAEIELNSKEEFFEKPKWVLEEVSEDKKYFNNNLLRNPYSTWK